MLETYIALGNRAYDDKTKIIVEYENKSKREIIEDAYKLAHINEIADVLTSISDYDDIDKETMQKMLNCEENILTKIYDYYMDCYYQYGDDYDFFLIDRVYDFIRDTFA